MLSSDLIGSNNRIQAAPRDAENPSNNTNRFDHPQTVEKSDAQNDNGDFFTRRQVILIVSIIVCVLVVVAIVVGLLVGRTSDSSSNNNKAHSSTSVPDPPITSSVPPAPPALPDPPEPPVPPTPPTPIQDPIAPPDENTSIVNEESFVTPIITGNGDFECYPYEDLFVCAYTGMGVQPSNFLSYYGGPFLSSVTLLCTTADFDTPDYNICKCVVHLIASDGVFTCSQCYVMQYTESPFWFPAFTCANWVEGLCVGLNFDGSCITQIASQTPVQIDSSGIGGSFGGGTGSFSIGIQCDANDYASYAGYCDSAYGNCNYAGGCRRGMRT